MLSFSNNNKPFNIFRIASVSLMTFVLMCCLSCSAMVLDTQPFDVLETAHFTFFYRKDGKTAKDLKKIAKYCENGINWLSAYLGFKIELKPDIYLFDNASGSFKEPFSNIELDSHSINGTIIYYYVERDYLTAASIILHEAVHVIQDFYFSLDNTALAEGVASFLSLKFYYYYLGANFGDDEIFNLLKLFALEGIMKYDGTPHELLKLSLPDFNRTDVLKANRDAGYRYEIMESFVAYLTKEYGIDKVTEWQRGTTTLNFEDNFKKVMGVSFGKCQEDWLDKIGFQ